MGGKLSPFNAVVDVHLMNVPLPIVVFMAKGSSNLNFELPTSTPCPYVCYHHSNHMDQPPWT